MKVKKDFGGTVVTSADSGTFTPTYGGHKKKKKKDGLDRLNRFINNKTPELTMYNKALIALTKWMAKQEDDQQKDRMKKIKDKEKNENSIDEVAPFTGHSDLALPILNYEK
tara:strand:+ start:1122 stop:1454 length:333 start_codon:yes stop_codon:yes gene_type:complete